MSTTSLKSLLIPSKTVTLEYPGFAGFEIEVSFLSRETLLNLRKKATKVSFKNRQTVEELNDDLFLEIYCKEAIKGWKGLKLAYLQKLALVELPEYTDEDELEYSPANALDLMKSSVDFDQYISNTVSELANFQKSSSKK